MNVLLSPLGFAPGAVSGLYHALEREEEIRIGRVITISTTHSQVKAAARVLERHFDSLGVAYHPQYIDDAELT